MFPVLARMPQWVGIAELQRPTLSEILWWYSMLTRCSKSKGLSHERQHESSSKGFALVDDFSGSRRQSRTGGARMELLLKVTAIVVVVCIAAFVLSSHWHERWGDNHY